MNIFDKETTAEVKNKLQKNGIKGLDEKSLMVYIASYFNHEMDAMKKAVVMAVISLWGIFASIVIGIITNFVTK